MALDVEAAAAGPAGELGVLPRRDVGVGLAVPLRQLLEYDGPRRHVDPQGEGLGREHHLHQAPQVERLDALLERRQHARRGERRPATQRIEEVVVAEHLEVGSRERAHGLLDVGEHLVALGGGVEPEVRVEALLDGGVTSGAAEDEDDRREQQLPLQALDHVDPPGDPDPAAVADAPGVLRRPRLALARRPSVAHQPGAGPVVPRDPHQLVVDRRSLPHETGRRVDVGRSEQVEEPTAHHDVLVERHGSPLGDDRPGLAPDRLEPLAELLGVRHGGRQRRHGHRLGEVDDHLLPHRAAGPVGEVVDLVHDHEPEPDQGPRPGVEHVAEHFGGHHDHGRLSVDARVAGEEADTFGPVTGRRGRGTSGWTVP